MICSWGPMPQKLGYKFLYVIMGGSCSLTLVNHRLNHRMWYYLYFSTISVPIGFCAYLIPLQYTWQNKMWNCLILKILQLVGNLCGLSYIGIKNVTDREKILKFKISGITAPKSGPDRGWFDWPTNHGPGSPTQRPRQGPNIHLVPTVG